MNNDNNNDNNNEKNNLVNYDPQDTNPLDSSWISLLITHTTCFIRMM
jgi:hypothetical protein